MGVDDLVGEAFSNGFDVSKSGFTGSLADEVDSLVNTSEGGDIDGLTSDNTTGTDTGGVLTGTTVLASGDEDLDGVLVGDEVNDFHGLCDNGDGFLLLTVVSGSGDHDHVGESFDDGALGLLETTFLVATGGEGGEDTLSGVLDLQVAFEGDVVTLNVVVRPFAEKSRFESELRSVVGLDRFCIHNKGYRSDGKRALTF